MAFNKFAVIALFAVYGPALVRAQELFLCDRYQFPDYEDCEFIVNQVDWSAGELPDDPPPVAPNSCAKFTSDEAPRCIVQACNHGTRNQPLNVMNGVAYYNVIRSSCEADDAGGEAPVGKETSIILSNNPDQPSSSRIKRAGAGGIVTNTITLAESKALLERAKQAAVSTEIGKRQDPGAWTNFGVSQSITTSQRTRLSPATSGGAAFSWTTTDGYSVGISSTVEVGGSFFELFSASVSLTVSAEYTQSYAETLTFDPTGRCDPGQSAVLYMYPLFDKYTGIYANDVNTAVEWFIPVAPPINTFIDVECLG
ncbi:hypothetical protein DE146DRAFT_634581 [Phaeosphaeria sp. MPI-PUGE-AT-0046c]|nr:hypothetical protein DE146DRAFT_634581 [Phaeosphaeria sp. MPI-PUGE-AT-0046c]